MPDSRLHCPELNICKTYSMQYEIRFPYSFWWNRLKVSSTTSAHYLFELIMWMLSFQLFPENKSKWWLDSSIILNVVHQASSFIKAQLWVPLASSRSKNSTQFLAMNGTVEGRAIHCMDQRIVVDLCNNISVQPWCTCPFYFQTKPLCGIFFEM